MDLSNIELTSLKSITLREIQLPLVHPFTTSFGQQDYTHPIIIEIEDNDGNIGWGETSVMKSPSYCYETLDTAWSVQTNFLIPTLQLINNTSFTLKELKNDWHKIRGHEFAKSGIEAALLSLYSNSNSISLGKLFKSTKSKIPTGVSLGIQKNIDTLIDRINYFNNEGYQRIKLKIKPNWDVKIIKAIRKEFGDIQLMVDANSAYTLDDLPIFLTLDKYELMMIEQPLDYNDILLHKKLQDEISTPICLDESIHNPNDAKLSIEHGACKIINIKPGRVGGYSNAIKIAEDLGKDKVWCGGMLETGIGRVQNILLQAKEEFTIPGDTSGSNRYYSPDIITPEVIVDQDGFIEVPSDNNAFHVNVDMLNKISNQILTYKL